MKRIVIVVCFGVLTFYGEAQAPFARTNAGGLHPNFCCRFGARERVHREGRFAPLLSYPFYFDDADYESIPAPQPNVVVLHDQMEPAKASAAVAPQLPKILEFPLPRTAKPAAKVDAIFICSDGSKVEAANYTITYSNISISHPRQQTETIPLDQLDIDATLRVNAARGLDLKIPRNKSEIFLSF